MGLHKLNEEMKEIARMKKFLIEEFSVAWNNISKFLFKFKDNLEELKRVDLSRTKEQDFLEENYFELFRAIIVKDQFMIETIKSLNRSVVFSKVLGDFSLLESLYDLISRGEISLNAINRGTISEEEYSLTFEYMGEIFQTCNKLLELLNVVERLLDHMNEVTAPEGDFEAVEFALVTRGGEAATLAEVIRLLDLIRNLYETSALSLHRDLAENQPIIYRLSTEPLGIKIYAEPEIAGRIKRAIIELRRGSYERVEYRLGVFTNVAQAVNDGFMEKELAESYKKRIHELSQGWLGKKIRLDNHEFPLGSPPEELMADVLED